MERIDTVSGRAKLAPRREPYWSKLAAGQHVGFRKLADGTGAWVARAYDPASKARTYKALGDLAGSAGADQWAEACKLARDWFAHVEAGGTASTFTVSQAGARYVEALRKSKGEASAEFARSRLAALVDPDPLGAVPLDKLREHHVTAWRDRVQGGPCTPPKRGPRCRNKAPQPQAAPRSAATVNRACTVLRAVLNRALDDRLLTSDLAWNRALRPAKGADGRRELYLTKDQRRALLGAIECPNLRAFIGALCVLPLRPGALAKLAAGDFDGRAGTLTVRHDKAGAGRRILLPESLADTLRAQARGKLPKAPLFARPDGKPWDSQTWQKPFKEAAQAAGLPDDAVAYTLRHCALTDLCVSGLDLMTVAALSGTSIAMLQKHYGHLQADRARDALAGLVL